MLEDRPAGRADLVCGGAVAALDLLLPGFRISTPGSTTTNIMLQSETEADATASSRPHHLSSPPSPPLNGSAARRPGPRWSTSKRVKSPRPLHPSRPPPLRPPSAASASPRHPRPAHPPLSALLLLMAPTKKTRPSRARATRLPRHLPTPTRPRPVRRPSSTRRRRLRRQSSNRRQTRFRACGRV